MSKLIDKALYENIGLFFALLLLMLWLFILIFLVGFVSALQAESTILAIIASITDGGD